MSPPLAKGEKLAAWGASPSPVVAPTPRPSRPRPPCVMAPTSLGGSKMFITNADVAGYTVVFATHDKKPRLPGGQCLCRGKRHTGFRGA